MVFVVPLAREETSQSRHLEPTLEVNEVSVLFVGVIPERVFVPE